MQMLSAQHQLDAYTLVKTDTWQTCICNEIDKINGAQALCLRKSIVRCVSAGCHWEFLGSPIWIALCRYATSQNLA